MPSTAIPANFIISRPSAAPPGVVQESGTYEGPLAALGIWTIPRGTLIKGSPWKLGVDLVIEIRTEASGYVAIHHAVDEYGVGATTEEAVRDLLSSLADYRAWLEKHRSRLANQERTALSLLQDILETQ